MTEEIIIDGVNVAGCEFCKPNPLYKIEYACHCRGYIQDDGLHVHLSCEHNPNCYYKQLKRLEQENKELIEDNLNLSKENEKLKKQLSSTKCHLCGEGFLTPEGAELYEEKNNYRYALEEIKEVASFHTTGADNEDVQNDMQVIIDKINEVLND